VDVAIDVHGDLGPGLLESVYKAVLARALSDRGRSAQPQVSIPIECRSRRFKEGFRADIVANGLVILEIKSVEELRPVHKQQLLTYLRQTGVRPGLLLNPGAFLMKDGITRIVDGLPED